MPLTQEEKTAIIAAVTAAVDGTPTAAPAPPLKPWRSQTPDPSWPLATRDRIPAGNVNDAAEIMRRAAFGYRIDGVRVRSGLALTLALTLCDEIGKAGSPTEAEALVAGIGSQSEDVAALLVLCGGVIGGGLSGDLYTFAPRPFVSLRDVAAWQSGVVSPDQPGPGVGQP